MPYEKFSPHPVCSIICQLGLPKHVNSLGSSQLLIIRDTFYLIRFSHLARAALSYEAQQLERTRFIKRLEEPLINEEVPEGLTKPPNTRPYSNSERASLGNNANALSITPIGIGPSTH